MIIFKLAESLEQIETEQLETEYCSAVILTSSAEAAGALRLAGIDYEGELSTDSIAFSKIETQGDFLL